MNHRINPGITPPTSDDEDSGYLDTPEAAAIDLGQLFSDRFSNIAPVHDSPGSPAVIYSATRYGKRFILKGLKTGHQGDPVHTLALAKEFEIGISVEHPNIRRTIGLEHPEELGQVIILEYIDGTTLESLLVSGSITPAQARSIAGRLADALRYLHTKQIVHRDLKPSNILITHQDSSVKIIDFNLADASSFIVLKNPAGTGMYMAPEQHLPDSEPAAAADIYSLGVIMSRIAATVADTPLAELSRLCTHPDPDRRPSAAELVEMLQRLPDPSSSLRPLHRLLASKAFTAVLTATCIGLAAHIAYTLITSHS